MALFPDLGTQLWARYKANNEAGADGVSIVPQDISGNARHMTQATTSLKPILKLAIQSGKSVYRFDGVDDYCDIPDMSALTALTAFIVMRRTADPPAAGGQTGLWVLGTAGLGVHVPWTDGIIYDDAGSTARKTTVDPALSMSTTFRRYCVRSAASDWKNYLDNTELFTTVTNTVGCRTNPLLGVAGTYYFDGDAAELVLCSSALSTSDRDALDAYAVSEYWETPPIKVAYTPAPMRKVA